MPAVKPPLDPSLYALDAQATDFFKSTTGIQDDAELKAHIIKVQQKAYEICGYPCIRRFSFLKFPDFPLTLKFFNCPKIDQVLYSWTSDVAVIGNDIRKVVSDGWPVENVVASDLRGTFWEAGHELFRSTSTSFPAAFVEGDALNSEFIPPREPFYEPPSESAPNLANLSSLSPLQGHVAAIHASSFVHLFNKEKQTEVCRSLATLLSPISGSTIFGSHVGIQEAGLRQLTIDGEDYSLFCHSPESWTNLWDGGIFKPGTVKVEAKLELLRRDVQVEHFDSQAYFLMCIMSDDELKSRLAQIPLDPSMYSLDTEEATFFKTTTGIQDDDKLKSHILAVQAKAYSVRIRLGIFRNGLKLSRHPAYEQVRKLPQERPGAILLDIGCCFGNDARKAALDGWPVENIIASDLRQDFWKAGHELFRTTPETFAAKFIAGDIFDPSHVATREPLYEEPSTPAPPLQDLTALTPLQGHISAIHASAFIHLFDEATQLAACKILASLLSPLPGSVIFGSHGGLPEKGLRQPIPPGGRRMFCHGPDSWKEIWDGIIFEKGKVKVEAEAVVTPRNDFASDEPFYLLVCMLDDELKSRLTEIPLDPNIYSLDAEEAAFFKATTGIQDDEALKAHILAVQERASTRILASVASHFSGRLKISRYPAYEQVRTLTRERPGSILLDIGCCFGNDVRKAVVDGWPVEYVIASDLRQDFWDAGHELFKTTPQSFPAKSIAGDIFDPSHVARREPF
ncbi:hypothetical protein ONZ45_g4715 [Pleurotus djamor]|nr:hypothetical protein ONZ45_g4715 [Pleurotus djamor]